MGSVVLTATNATWAWTNTGGATSLTAEAIGAGGGGGGVSGNPACGGGGKGGGYAKVVIVKGAENSLNITVGAAGTAGASGGGAGGNGGVSSIVQDVTTVLLATGGVGGAGGIADNYSGTGATTENGTGVGDLVRAGGNGGNGKHTVTQNSGGGGGAAGPTAVGGNATLNTAGAHGAGNFLNGTDYCSLGAAGRITTAAAGLVGPGVGAGGSGGFAISTTNRAGGAGYRGVVVLSWDPVLSNSETTNLEEVQKIMMSEVKVVIPVS
jgi:hypothetical protein